MTNKEAFILEIEQLIAIALEEESLEYEGLSTEAQEYFDSLKVTPENTTSKKEKITDKGAKILKYMQENYEKNNSFKAKDIAEALFIAPRSISSSIRKLVTDGYVEKISGDDDKKKAASYAITDKGIATELKNE